LSKVSIVQLGSTRSSIRGKTKTNENHPRSHLCRKRENTEKKKNIHHDEEEVLVSTGGRETAVQKEKGGKNFQKGGTSEGGAHALRQRRPEPKLALTN